LKPERWGSLLVQEEKYRGEKDYDRRNNNNNNNNNTNILYSGINMKILRWYLRGGGENIPR
jgi:hypothetical protein